MEAVVASSVTGEPLHHFLGILTVICLAVLQARVGRQGAFWYIIWALPGTVLHELSHLLVAAVTGGKPAGFSIFPRRDPEEGWVLGSVTITNPGPISALPSALAPLWLNVVAYFLFVEWGLWFPQDLPHTLLRYLTVYLFAYSSVPSGRDILVAISSPVGVALYGTLFLLLGVYLWSV